MNYPAILLWSLVCVLVIWLILLPSVDGYTIKILNTKLEDKPMVCFYAVPGEFKWSSYKAMHIWNHALEKYDYPDRIKYKHLPDPYSIETFDISCNIHIRFMDVIIWDGEEQTYWGIAPCNSEFCSIQISTKDRTLDQRVRTIAHEVGHALSLLHITPDNPPEALELPCSLNVMWTYSCMKGLPIVNKSIILSLECIHAEDGFGGNYDAHCKSLKFGKDII